jgi:hypothetical protein
MATNAKKKQTARGHKQDRARVARGSGLRDCVRVEEYPRIAFGREGRGSKNCSEER